MMVDVLPVPGGPCTWMQDTIQLQFKQSLVQRTACKSNTTAEACSLYVARVVRRRAAVKCLSGSAHAVATLEVTEAVEFIAWQDNMDRQISNALAFAAFPISAKAA